MAMLDKIGQEKQRISAQLMRVDAERTKLSDQLNELEIAERALNRFGRKAVAIVGRSRGGDARTAPTAGEKHGARGGQPAPNLSLRDAALKAVQAHASGASANEILDYLSRRFGLTVRPNHLGSALQGHRRAGRLEKRGQRWYLPTSA